MQPPKFLTGRRRDGSMIWASIDQGAHHVESETCERRFGAYLRPFKDQESARRAIIAAGCDPASIGFEQRRKRGRSAQTRRPSRRHARRSTQWPSARRFGTPLPT